MKILVTGGLGFIGSNFILHLYKNYPEISIINIDAGFIGSNKKNLGDVENSERYQFISGNINDRKLIEKIIPEVEGVINFAAESHVDRSIFDPKPFLESNIMGVYSILDVIRNIDPKTKFLQISTDEVFGSKEQGLANEMDVFKPSNPYSASKASSELIIESYKKTYELDVMITRCTNNFGALQFPEKIIPKTIIRAHKGLKIPIYGSGKNIRDWLYVEDHCNAVMKVFLEGSTGESYNISGTNELTNIELVEKILDFMGKSEDLIYFVEDRPGHDIRYGIDSSKIRKELAWKPKHQLDKALHKTIDWYLENKEWWEELATDEMLDTTPWKRYRKN